MGNSTHLDLSQLPPIFILPLNVQEDELREVEDTIYEHTGQLSYLPSEARIFLGRISQKKRAAFELRSRGLWTEEGLPLSLTTSKKRKVRPTELDDEEITGLHQTFDKGQRSPRTLQIPDLQDHVIVLKIDWIKKSVEAGKLLPVQLFLVYSGRIIDSPKAALPTKKSTTQPLTIIKLSPDATNTNKAGSSQSPEQEQSLPNTDRASLPNIRFAPRRFRDQQRGRWAPSSSTFASLSVSTHPRLHRTTTSEHDFGTTNLPPPPAWLTEKSPRPNYSCLRSTFVDPANRDFLSHLYKIKDARTLTLDEIGVRAYSTAIASLSAYPHIISNPSEITKLPGCSDKIAALWQEWYTSSPDDPSQRRLSITNALDADEDLKHLKLFYDIWGVGADTARKFYFEHGWKDLDDVVEYGWNDTLNRVQQIGVKFYDEFKIKIPRAEVENIADTILHHARLCKNIPEPIRKTQSSNWNKPDNGHGDASQHPDDMVCVIVGGYRRGKTESGDVDVILSHRSEDLTRDLVLDVVRSLETSGHITHTLTLHTTNSDRGQQTLALHRPPGQGHAGGGFDTLDKALCVWQDPEYDGSIHEKNPNIHRRVDIIVSPWRTVGAAVLGWSGATTFERDVRRWCRKEMGWKFDSSGVRDRATGEVLDFETPKQQRRGTKGKEKEKENVDSAPQEDQEVEDIGDGWEDRERRLMEGLGIGWRPACERITG